MIGSLIQKALQGGKTAQVPFWFMRQAGRYLPEYRELRAKANGFLALCYTPDYAAEVTLQPIRRFDMDAAIIFSDILVVPHAMGLDLRFEQGEGPKLTPVRDIKAITALKEDIAMHFAPIEASLARVRKALAPEKSLIGFCGAAWTVACYMVEGGGSRDFERVRQFALTERAAFSELIERIVAASVTYLALQVKAGADVLQIFDSWAGVLSEAEFRDWVIAPTTKIIRQVKALHPDVPIIGFARGAGTKLPAYAAETGISGVGIDSQTPLQWAGANVVGTLQGNLDPLLLAADKRAAMEETRRILDSCAGKPFIFNLGHGIIPSTPIENVEAVCRVIREYGQRRKTG